MKKKSIGGKSVKGKKTKAAKKTAPKRSIGDILSDKNRADFDKKTQERLKFVKKHGPAELKKELKELKAQGIEVPNDPVLLSVLMTMRGKWMSTSEQLDILAAEMRTLRQLVEILMEVSIADKTTKLDNPERVVRLLEGLQEKLQPVKKKAG